MQENNNGRKSFWHEVGTVDEADMDGVDGKETHEVANYEGGKNENDGGTDEDDGGTDVNDGGTDEDDDVAFTGLDEAADLGSGSRKADTNFKLPGSTKRLLG